MKSFNSKGFRQEIAKMVGGQAWFIMKDYSDAVLIDTFPNIAAKYWS